MSSKPELRLARFLRGTPSRIALGAAISLLIHGGALADTYRVQRGDTLETIAKQGGTTITAIQQLNPNLNDPRRLQAGQIIELPGNDTKSQSYTVKAGDTLSGVATRLGLHIDALKAVNPQLRSPFTLRVGQVLQLPVSTSAARDTTPVVNAAGYGGGWLTPLQGVITSAFGPRTLNGKREVHDGLDMRAAQGTPVKATRAGVVKEAYNDTRTGWGVTVLIDHGGGWTSRYGHLSQLSVKAGQRVPAGQVVGLSGNTGRSNGPHLHYSVYFNGRAVDPTTLK